LVSQRIHASPPTLWTVLPTCRGLAGSALNLGWPQSSGPGRFLGSWLLNQVLIIRLVQWLGWIFEPKERKKESVCENLGSYFWILNSRKRVGLRLWQDQFYGWKFKPKSASSILPLQALSWQFCGSKLSNPSKLVISKKRKSRIALLVHNAWRLFSDGL